MSLRSFDLWLWRLWALEFHDGIAHLVSPITPTMPGVESLSIAWRDSRTATARCARCPEPPGNQCSCGIHCYKDLDSVWELLREISRHRRTTREPMTRPQVISYGRAEGHVFPDWWPGNKQHCLRVAEYTLHQLFVWPEEAHTAKTVSSMYGRVPTTVMPWSPERALATMAGRITDQHIQQTFYAGQQAGAVDTGCTVTEKLHVKGGGSPS